MTVGIKLCGHCSPRRDMMEVAEELKGSAEHIRYVFTSCCQTMENVDILLILNACGSACAERPSFPGPVIIATPEMVDRRPVGEGESLTEIILEQIENEAKGFVK